MSPSSAKAMQNGRRSLARRLFCAIVLGSCILAVRPAAFADDNQTPTPPPGWLGASDYPKALKLAKKNGQATAIFFTYGSKTRYFGRGKAFGTYVLSQPGLTSMVRVMVFAEKTPDFLQDIRGKVGDTSGFMPQLYLLDPNGKIAGFAASGDRALVVKAITVVNQLTAWLKKSDRQLQGAAKHVAAGRYGSALRLIENIDLEDRKMTAAVAGVVPQYAGGTTQPTTGPSASGASADVNIFARPTDAASPEPQEQDLPPGTYYPGLLAGKRTEYEASANDRLAKAQAEFDQKQYAEAKKLLTPMVEDTGADFDAVKQAAELLKQIDAAGHTSG